MPSVSAKQHNAMEAAAHGNSTLGIPKAVGEEFVAADALNGHAAGILYVAADGDILLLRRADTEPNYGGYWALPGGKGEVGETPQITAIREAAEEMAGGPGPGAGMKLIDAAITPTGMAFYTFAAAAVEKFQPSLNEEHTGFAWAPLSKLPAPLHPAVAAMLAKRLDIDRTDLTGEAFGELVARFAAWAHDNDNAPAPITETFAIDAESVRSYDADGRLHVSITPISKANICGYYGREIPGGIGMGLEPERKYMLLRDAEELKRAAPTFNGLPVMRRHVATSAADHKAADTIGATGTDAAFEAPFLVNSMVIWPREDIKDVEAALKRELSCGYRYRADMTPGIFEGQPYDGVMRDIVGNHVAIVREGRAGPDVIVGDEKPADPKAKRKFALDEGLAATVANSAVPQGGKFKADDGLENGHPVDCDCADCAAARDAKQANDSKEPAMPKITLSPKATLARGALITFLAPRLAEDAQIDLPPLLSGITAKNYKAKRAGLLTSVSAAVTGKLAQDAKLDGLDTVLMALDSVEAADLPKPGGGMGRGPGAGDKKARDSKRAMDKKARDEAAEGLKEKLKDKFGEDSDDYKAACDDIDGMMAASDEEEENAGGDDPERTNKPHANDRRRGKDANPDDDEDDEEKGMGKDEVQHAVDSAIQGERQRQNAKHEALVFVRPYVGDLAMAFDTAEDVFGKVLEMKGVATKGVHPSAYKAMVGMLPKPGAARRIPIGNDNGAMGMDAKAEDKLEKLYPGISAVRIGG